MKVLSYAFYIVVLFEYGASFLTPRSLAWYKFRKESFRLRGDVVLNCLSSRSDAGTHHVNLSFNDNNSHRSGLVANINNKEEGEDEGLVFVENKQESNNISHTITTSNYDSRFTSDYSHGIDLINKDHNATTHNYHKQHEKGRNFVPVIEALAAYKAIHGNLTVPRDYKIPPNDTRYSEKLWGMNLGSVVRNIRHRNTHEKHKEELLSMGFSYGRQMGGFLKVKEALTAYKAIYGDLMVPRDYKIPSNDTRYSEKLWGMKLGNVVRNIRHQNTFEQHKEELLAIGLHYGRQLGGFANVKAALTAYKAIYGNLLVPRDYEIRFNDTRYNDTMWGMKLGNIVIGIRCCNMYKSRRQELLAIGFDYDKQLGEFEEVFQALLVYKSIFGNVDVPRNFAIKVDDERYSSSVRKGFIKLGEKVNIIKRMDQYTQHRAELEAIGIKYTFQPVPFSEFKAALEIYKQDHGDCYVTRRYDTRGDARYPVSLQGSNKMYKYVNCIRAGLIYRDEFCRNELLAMGFDYHKKEGDFELVKQALLTYKTIHGNLLVPADFQIPLDDMRYPSQMRGRILGEIVSTIRNKNYYKRYKQELLEIGFDFSKQQKGGDFLLVREALLAYKKLHGDLFVPQLYVIPSDSTDYPDAVKGMKLGNIVSNIRHLKTYKMYREELITMGFCFDVKQQQLMKSN